MKGETARNSLQLGVLLLSLVAASTSAQEQQEQKQDPENQEPEKQEAREVLEDALLEHRPWWMPGERRDPRQKLLPDSAFKLQVEEDTKLSLDEVVLQIRRSYEGRVVRATETEDGFVVRLLLDGGRIRTLQVSPEGRVVRAHVDEP